MASGRRLPLRVLVAAVALALAALVLSWRGDRQDCERDGGQVLALRGGAPARLDAAIARVSRDCRSTVVPLAASAALRGAGDDRRAAALAREATRKEPRNFTAWAALYAALLQDDPRQAAAARERAVRLNPSSARALGGGR
jgi:hypothetical protein